MADDRLAVWNALDETQRSRVLAAIGELTAERARADRDLYASNFTKDPRVEIIDSAGDIEHLTVRYLFHWWEWCPAQSGSDWNYHCVYRGTASFAGDTLAHNEIEMLRRDYVHESDEERYDREAVLSEVRSELRAAAITPAEPTPHLERKLDPALPLRQAVIEGRVLLVREILSQFASGSVEFARATPDDLNQSGGLDADYLEVDQPLTDDDVRGYNEGSWDSPREFWETHRQARIASAGSVYEIAVDRAPLPVHAPSPAQGWALVDLVGDLDRRQRGCLRRICIGAQLRRLTSLPGWSAPVADLLELADEHALDPTPEIAARAGELARRAAELGGSALFGVPLQLLSVDDAAEIVARTLDAERALAAAGYPGAKRNLGDDAASALKDELRVLIARLSVRDSALASRDLLQDTAWRFDPERWQLEAGVLHGVVSSEACEDSPFPDAHGFAYLEEPQEDFELSVDFKISGAAWCHLYFRLAPTAPEPHSGYWTTLADRSAVMGGLNLTGTRWGPLVPAVPVPPLQVRVEGWNTCFVRAEGRRIRVALNGIKSADITDEAGSLRGAIGIEVRSEKNEIARAWFKNMRLCELPSV